LIHFYKRALSFISEKLVLVDEWSCVFPSFYPALFLLPPHGQIFPPGGGFVPTNGVL